MNGYGNLRHVSQGNNSLVHAPPGVQTKTLDNDGPVEWRYSHHRARVHVGAVQRASFHGFLEQPMIQVNKGVRDEGKTRSHMSRKGFESKAFHWIWYPLLPSRMHMVAHHSPVASSFAM